MPDLTLEQVRDAGRFAWHPREYLFVPGIGVLSISDEYSCDEQQGWESIEVNPTAFLRSWATGWHHIPGCHCEYCK